jgi:hypothetical protein
MTARTPNGVALKGTAGPRVLGDLGLTDAELAAFLPPDAPKWLRGVFGCQFEGPPSLDAIAAHFAGRYTVERRYELKFPPDGPEDGVSVDAVIVRPKGQYVVYVFYGMRGETYVVDGSWQLEVSFRESGTDWGSNRAVYERFKAVELPGLGARDVVELTD